MPASAADVARATRAAAIDIQSDAGVLARQAGARDNFASPRPGFWDSPANAATVNAAGFALIGTERRRFSVRVADVLELAGWLDASQITPTVTLVDAALVVNGPMLISRIEIDDAAGITALEVFG